MKKRRISILVIVVACAVMMYAAVRLSENRDRINEERKLNEDLAAQVADKEVSNAEIEYYIEHSDEDSVIADIARDELGLVEPGEKVFYDTGK